MQIGDDALSSIILAGRGILVKMLITLNGMLYMYFDKKKSYLSLTLVLCCWYFFSSVDSEDELVQPPFKLRNSKLCSFSSLNRHKIFQRLAKALIRLRICAG